MLIRLPSLGLPSNWKSKISLVLELTTQQLCAPQDRLLVWWSPLEVEQLTRVLSKTLGASADIAMVDGTGLKLLTKQALTSLSTATSTPLFLLEPWCWCSVVVLIMLERTYNSKYTRQKVQNGANLIRFSVSAIQSGQLTPLSLCTEDLKMRLPTFLPILLWSLTSPNFWVPYPSLLRNLKPPSELDLRNLEQAQLDQLLEVHL